MLGTAQLNLRHRQAMTEDGLLQPRHEWSRMVREKHDNADSDDGRDPDRRDDSMIHVEPPVSSR